MMDLMDCVYFLNTINGGPSSEVHLLTRAHVNLALCRHVEVTLQAHTGLAASWATVCALLNCFFLVSMSGARIS